MSCTSPALRLCLIATVLAWAGLGRPTAHAQEAPPHYVQEHWTVEDGLPSNHLSIIRQAADGYIWLGTDQGLVRFDGFRFTAFTPENSPGLPNGDIHRLYEASDTSFWIQTAYRQAVHLKHGVFTAYDAEQGLPKGATWLEFEEDKVWFNYEFHSGDGGLVRFPERPKNRHVTTTYQGPDGARWFGTGDQGLIRYQDGRYTTYSTDQGLAGTRVYKIRGDTRDPDVIWFLAGKQLHRFHGGQVAHIPLPLEISLFFQEPSGRWWLAGADGMYRSEGHDPTQISPVDPIGEHFYFFRWEPYVDAEGHVWVASPRHLFRDGEIVFSHSHLTHFVVDTFGSVWITTKDDGLYRLKPALFQVYSEQEGFLHEVVFPLLEDREGALWIGTQHGGLNKLEQGRVTVAGVPGLPSPSVYALHQDRAGTLWVGTQAGVCRIEGERCRRDPALRFQHITRAILEDRQGALWFGTEKGLYRYAHGQVTTYTTELVPEGMSNDWIQGILEARDGTLWMATNGGGILRYRDGQFTPFTTAEGLSSDVVHSLYEDAEGILWVATGGGLHRIALVPGQQGFENAEVTVYREEEGFKMINTIMEDDHGRLWMTSYLGIFWVWKQALNEVAIGRSDRVHTVVYTERDGLRSRAAGTWGIQPACVQARDGRLWFATEDGAAVVDPGTLDRYATPPSVVIEGLSVWGQPRAIQRGAVALAATERQVSIDYTALSWPDGDRARFAYWLEGYDEDWVEAGGKREAIYGGLGPGRYTFRVRAMNHQRVWSEEEASLRITIAPFYYETVWFWLVSGMGMLMLLGGVYRWRVRRLLARKQVLEALVAERTAEVARQAEELRALDEAKSRFFANISHEFRTPLTLAMGPLEDLKARRHGTLPPGALLQIEQALLNNRRLLRLVNQLLDVARLEVHELTLHVRAFDLNAFLNDIARAFAPLAERKHITFTRELTDAPTRLFADPDQLEKVVTNLLSNAFKFTPEHGRITLVLQGHDDEIVLQVRDTGPGIPADHLPRIFDRFHQADTGAARSQAGTGIGLALAKELVELHGGRIQVESAEGFGTTFTVTLPSGLDHFEAAGHVVQQKEGDAAPARVPSDAVLVGLTEAHLEASETQAANATEEDRTTILVVDDNAEIRAFVGKHLRDDYQVVEAADGAEGLALARALTPDLIVSDVMMPEMDGYAFCRAIRQDPELDFLPVILLTARAAVEDKLEGLARGADDYLTKPFSTDELKARIRNLIAQRQRLRDRFRASAAASSLPPMDAQSSDAVFLDGLRAAVDAHLSDEAFTVEALAETVGIDRSHLYRRMQDLLGQSPSAYLWGLRLEKAAQLLAAQAGTVSEVAYGVGFKSVPHFARRFRARYGCSPSAYAAARVGDASS